MLTLNSRLSTVGISAARGVDLAMQHDQVKATLPAGTGGGRAETPTTSEKSDAPRVAAKPALTPEQLRLVRDLQQIDRSVRAHEQAHLSAGGGVVTGGASFSYTYGPDGRQYATSGEVGIDTSPERDPAANIDKGRAIQAAALAPRDPSPQDYQVAAVGSRLEGQGRSDLVRQQQEEVLAAEETARERRAQSSDDTQAVQPTEPVEAQESFGSQQVGNAYRAGGTPGGTVNTFA